MFNPNDTKWDAKLDFSVGLPDGDHVTFISDVSPGVSKGGTPYVELEFTCHDPASPHRNKSQRYEKFWTSEKALPRFVRLCRAAGVLKPFNLNDPASVSDALLDRLIRITIRTKAETYNGVTRNRSEVAMVAPLKASDRERLLAEYGDTLLPALDEEPTAGRQYDGVAAASGEPQFDDDDLPF